MLIERLQGMRMPGLSMAFMTISAALAIILPIILLIWFNAKHKTKIIPSLVGVGIFVVFALILEQLFLNLFQLDFLLGVYPTPVSNYVVYILIVCLSSGIFEETGRFIAFKWILKNDNEDIRTPLAYGIGHGGIESILLVGTSMVSLIFTAIMINNGQIANVLENEMTNDRAVGFIDFVQTDSHMFLAAGVERVTAIALHLCLSVLVWLAVTHKNYLLYAAAILIHALTNVSAVLYQLEVLENVWVTEGLIALCVIATVIFTRWIYLKLQIPLEERTSASD